MTTSTVRVAGLAVALVLGVACVTLGDGSLVARDIGGGLLLAVAPVALVGAFASLITMRPGPIERALRGSDYRAGLGPIEQTVLVLAAGLACVALGAVLLDVIGVRVGAKAERSWMVVVGALSVATYGWAARRRGGAPARPVRGRLPVAAAAAVVLLGAGLAIGISVTKPPRPAHGALSYSVLAMQPAGDFSLTLHVQSFEPQVTTYMVKVLAGGRSLPSARVTLRPGERWTGKVDLRSYGGVNQRITAALYSPPDARSPYRTVNLEP